MKIDITESDRERFEAKFMPEPMSGCWLWIGSNGSCGYGNFYIDCRLLRANRASWMIYKGGDLTRHDFICHRCDTPCCVNPDHLFLGNAATNVADMKKKGRDRYPVGMEKANAKFCDDDIRRIMADRRPHSAIARDAGVHIGLIAGIKSGRRWRHITKGIRTSNDLPRGEKNIHAKLTKDEVLSIRGDERQAGEIAADYSVSRQTIHRIKTRRNWAHVD